MIETNMMAELTWIEYQDRLKRDNPVILLPVGALEQHGPHLPMGTDHMIIMPRVGDVMFTNKRRPILTIVEDSSPGIHDTIIAACDRYRYKFLGVRATTTTAPTISTRAWPSSA
jgi:Creatinine amidohydrolase/Domain of unknown function (DUF1989)